MKRLPAIFLLLVIVAAARADDAPKPIPPKDLKLQLGLMDRHKADQDARRVVQQWMSKYATNGVVIMDTLPAERKAEFEKITAAVKKIDTDNTAWLKGVVDKSGWPTNAMVGQEGAHDAWILIQHSDDVPFQRKCLDLMAKLPKDEISQPSVAFLTDKVLLAEGKKQLYGTQFASIDGKVQPKPLEDAANVDQRRAEIGLPPLADYGKMMEQQYHSGGGK